MGTARRSKVKVKPPPLFTVEGLEEADGVAVMALNEITLEERGTEAEDEMTAGRTDAETDEAEAEVKGEALLTEMGVGRADAEALTGLEQSVGAAKTVDTTVTVTMPLLPITIVGVATGADEEVTMADAGEEEAEETVGRGIEGISARVTGSSVATWRL